MRETADKPPPSLSGHVWQKEDFSLVIGGPLFQILRRTYLSGNALELLRRRIVFFVALTWLPLCFLSLWEGTAWSRSIRIPFLFDIGMHIRFLLVVPTLLAAELIVHQRLRPLVRQFFERDLIPPNAQERFHEAIASALRLRNSITAEVLLLFVAFVFSALVVWRRRDLFSETNWYSRQENGRLMPTWAGWWLACVSLPVIQLLIWRWLYRLAIWSRMLWQISRIKLNLVPTHPDRAGGLGFLAQVSYAFSPFLLAQGLMLTAVMANRIFFAGAHFVQFKLEIVGIVGLMLLLILGPFLVFVPQLERTKRQGLREYGRLAQVYVREFDDKWLRGTSAPSEPLLGTADIQSLADLGNSYEVVKEMRLMPLSFQTVLRLALITLIPVAPLTLTMISLDQLVDRILSIFF